jgi:hypothetical protein
VREGWREYASVYRDRDGHKQYNDGCRGPAEPANEQSVEAKVRYPLRRRKHLVVNLGRSLHLRDSRVQVVCRLQHPD